MLRAIVALIMGFNGGFIVGKFTQMKKYHSIKRVKDWLLIGVNAICFVIMLFALLNSFFIRGLF